MRLPFADGVKEDVHSLLDESSQEEEEGGSDVSDERANRGKATSHFHGFLGMNVVFYLVRCSAVKPLANIKLCYRGGRARGGGGNSGRP